MSQQKEVSAHHCYLGEEEKSVLQQFVIEWSSQPDKRSWDAFVASRILPRIQSLNQEKFGPEKISHDKEAKKLWEKRVKVRKSLM